MKKSFQLFAVIAMLCITRPAFAQHSIGDLAGRWQTADGNSGNVEFLDGSKVQVAINGMQTPAVAYTIDFSKTPVWFDVFVASGKTVKGLLEFEDDDTIKWQIFLSGDRGYDFTESDGDPTLVFKRVK